MSLYGNIPSNVGGHSFGSRLEGRRYAELLLLEKAGEVRKIELQVTYRLEVKGQLICKYVADFVYEEKVGGAWKTIVEDTKGVVTPLFRIKAKLMQAIHGIDINIRVAAGGASTKQHKRVIPTRPLPKGRKLRA